MSGRYGLMSLRFTPPPPPPPTGRSFAVPFRCSGRRSPHVCPTPLEGAGAREEVRRQREQGQPRGDGEDRVSHGDASVYAPPPNLGAPMGTGLGCGVTDGTPMRRRF